MKRLLLLASTALLTSSLFSQIKIVKPSDLITDLNGATVEINSPASTQEMKTEAWIINLGTSSVTLKCRRTEVDVIIGTTNATCWNICPPYLVAGVKPSYVANIANTDLTQTIAINDTNKTFAGHYTPENISGCSLFLYEWFDGDDPSITLASLYVRYIHNGTNVCTASINEKNETQKIAVYPNPASSQLTISFDANYNQSTLITYEIVNLLGEVVATKSFNSTVNIQQLNVSNLNEGIYFVRFKNNSTVLSTKKITIVK